jgi:hypothetical protein
MRRPGDLNIQTKQLLYKREEDGEMSDKVELKDGLYYPPDQFSAKAHVSNLDEYKAMYERSISDPEGFWAEQAGEFHWEQKWDKVLEYNYARSNAAPSPSNGSWAAKPTFPTTVWTGTWMPGAISPP